MEERWASVSGGSLRYLVGGDGPPLVLVHGIVASSFSFRLNCDQLSRHFRLFLPDLRMVGADGGLGSTADLLRQFLDYVGIEKADLLGSSHGGAVLMCLASQVPERFRRMVLVSPVSPFAENYKKVVRFYLSGLGGIFVRLAPIMPVRLWDYGIGRMFGDRTSMPVGTGLGYRQPLRASGMTTHILSTLKTFNADVETLLPKLPDIGKIPSLLIWGERDPVVEIESGFRLQKALGAEMAIMPGIGHLPYEEGPAEFSRIVLQYLKSGDQAIG